METGMLHLHSFLRYVVIIVAVWAIIKMATGMNGRKPFSGSARLPALLLLITIDLQLLIGLYLYFVGPWGFKNIQNQGFGAVMENTVSRFFAIEHVVGMFLALILIHIGYAISKKSDISDKKKFTKVFWYFLIGFLLVLAFIPWPFREQLGRHWLP